MSFCVFDYELIGAVGVFARRFCGRMYFSKYQFDTLDCTLEELAVLELVAKNPTMKQQELVEATGKSIATIKRIMKSLQDKNYIRRENGKRYGKWEVLA